MFKNPLFIFLLILGGCSAGAKKESATSNGAAGYPASPIIIEDSTEGWGADMKLSIVNEATTDTSTVYKVNGLYEGKNTGFELAVPLKGFRGITLKSSGEASDNFLRLLKKLYSQKDTAAHSFTNAVSVSGMNMSEFAKQLGAKSDGNDPVVKYKIFFQGDKEADYAELYININPSEHWVEWKEKDEEYRPVITRLLTKK